MGGRVFITVGDLLISFDTLEKVFDLINEQAPYRAPFQKIVEPTGLDGFPESGRRNIAPRILTGQRTFLH
jgi:hypothetical protein